MSRGNGLSDAYTETLVRLKGQKGNKAEIGLKVLMWVLYSERPLRAEELCHALSVEMGSLDLDPENIPVLRTLLSSCLGLVTVEASSSTVRLVHFTLQEHPLSSSTLFRGPHTTIAEVCLTYLNFRCIRDLQLDDFWSAPSTMPFLEYASLYWGKRARMGMTENVKILALKLLGGFDEHVSAQLPLLGHNENREDWDPDFDSTEGPTGFTALHAASFLGIVEIVAIVLEKKEWDANATDCLDRTALKWAARNGHEEVVKMLLEREEINPDQADDWISRTPISYAAEKGHSGIVKMLLEREEVNPDRADTDYGETPISWAALSGHEGIVKMLLEREEVNPDRAETRFGQTPLSLAAEGGHEGVVKMLLQREEVNPGQADRSGQTPISQAAERGHEGVVKMLLEREEVNLDRADRYGQRPISLAVAKGHGGIVKMLLERHEVNPNQSVTDIRGTPPPLAARPSNSAATIIPLKRKRQ